MRISEEVRDLLMETIEEEIEVAKRRRRSIAYHNELIGVYAFLDNHKHIKLKRVKNAGK